MVAVGDNAAIIVVVIGVSMTTATAVVVVVAVVIGQLDDVPSRRVSIEAGLHVEVLVVVRDGSEGRGWGRDVRDDGRT